MDRAKHAVFREIASDDYQRVVPLLIEMQVHYKVHVPTPDQILAGLAERPSGTRILLAFNDTDLVGLAAFSAIYPGPGLTPGVFLKDLFVVPQFRRTGLGKGLLQALAKIAVTEGLGRIDWTADAGDKSLLSFYELLGGRALTERTFFRLTGTALDELAAAAK